MNFGNHGFKHFLLWTIVTIVKSTTTWISEGYAAYLLSNFNHRFRINHSDANNLHGFCAAETGLEEKQVDNKFPHGTICYGISY